MRIRHKAAGIRNVLCIVSRGDIVIYYYSKAVFF